MGRRKEPIERMTAKSKGDGKTPGGREITGTVVRAASNNAVPAVPENMGSGRGVQEWQAVWSAGWWLNREQDYHWVEMIARAYADIEVFRRQVEDEGRVVTGYAGQVVAHPLIKEIRDCEKTIQKCLSILGFSPTDRARLAITEAKAKSALQAMIDGAN